MRRQKRLKARLSALETASPIHPDCRIGQAYVGDAFVFQKYSPEISRKENPKHRQQREAKQNNDFMLN